jgi:hypothetical protein
MSRSDIESKDVGSGIQFTSTKQAMRFVSGFLQGGTMVVTDSVMRSGETFTLHLALPGRQRSATTMAQVRTVIGRQKSIVLAHSAEADKPLLHKFQSSAANASLTGDAEDPDAAPELLSEDDYLAREREAATDPPPTPADAPEDEDTTPKSAEEELASMDSPSTDEPPGATTTGEQADVDARIQFESVAYVAKFLAELRGGNTPVLADAAMPVGSEFDVELLGLPNDERLTVRVAACGDDSGVKKLLLGTMVASQLDDLWLVMTAACKHPDVRNAIDPNRHPSLEWLHSVEEPESVPAPPVVDDLAPEDPTDVSASSDSVDSPPLALGDESPGPMDDPQVEDAPLSEFPAGRVEKEVYGQFEALPIHSSIRIRRTWDTLDEVPRVGVWLIHLFGFLCRKPHTGVLQFNHGNNTVEVIIRDDMVEDVRVADQRMNEMLGGLLLSNKVIRVTQLQEAMDIVQEEGVRIDKAFFKLDMATPADIVKALRQAYIRLVEECFEAHGGTYRFQQWTQLPHQAGPIQMTLHQLTASCLRTTLCDLEVEDMDAHFEPIMECYPFIPPERLETVAQLSLSQKERHVVDHILNGSVTLSKGFAASALNASQLSRLVVSLSVIGCLEFMATQQRYAPGESPEERLATMVERLESQHYFERLHIHWTEHGPAIENAYMELRVAYGPQTKDDAHTLKAAELAERVWFLIEEAYQRLSTPDGRRRIRSDIFDESAITNAGEVLFQQGEMAAFRGERVEARTVFERAIDLDPKPDYEEALNTHCGTFETVKPTDPMKPG